MQLISFSQIMYSLLLLLTKDFIFLQLEATLLLFASEIFQPCFNFFAHVSKKVVFG